MSFADRFKRRQGLGAITGYNGGSLQDQLNADPYNRPDAYLNGGGGQPMAQPDIPDTSTRPRVVSPFVNRFNQPTQPATPNPFAGPSVPRPSSVMSPVDPSQSGVLTSTPQTRGLPQQGTMPGAIHLNPAIAPQVPQGSPRPLAPGEWVDNPDGSWSSEISSTVQNPDKSWSVVPGMWLVNGKPQRVNEDTATQYAQQSGLNFPKYNSLAEAEKFATDRESAWQGIKPQEATRIAPLWSSNQTTRPRIMNPFANRLMNQPDQPIPTGAPPTQGWRNIPSGQPDVQINRNEPPMRPAMPMATAADVPDTSVSPDQSTRPRMANPNPFLDRLMNNPAMQERTRQLNPPDAITSDSDYLRQIQGKPDTLRDKLGLVAQSISRNLGGQPLPTRKQHEEEQATGALQRDLAVERQQVLNQQGMMVPVYDNQGNVIGNAPARTAASTQIRQNLGQDQQAERKRVNDERFANWHSKNKAERNRVIMDEYKSGLLNGNPEALQQAARELGIPGDVKDKFIAGQFRGDVDANGNLIRENLQTGEATPITQTTPQGQTAPVQSFKVTQQNRQDERARLGRAAAMDRAIVMARAQGARLGDPNVYKGMADDADADAAAALAQADQLKSSQYASDKKAAAQYRAEAQKHKDRATKLRELETKASGGQSPQGTMQTAAPSTGGSFNLGAWKSDHPNATPAQIEAQRAKAKGRQLAIVE